MTIPLTQVSRLPDRYIVLNTRDGQEVVELTRKQYEDLALKGAGAPPGVSKEDWESNKVCAAGGVRNYGNGQRILKLGEYAELSDRFELAIVQKDLGGMKQTQEILKSKVNCSETTGLTITKIDEDAWPDEIGIVSIVNGILTME
jgi:hypothetical protein